MGMKLSDIDASFEAEVRRLMDLSEADLYAEIAPADTAFDLQGRIAAGKEALSRVLHNGRQNICETYHKNKSAVRDASDLVRVLTDSLGLVVAAAGFKVPVIPVAVLIFKVGIEKVCPTKQTA